MTHSNVDLNVYLQIRMWVLSFQTFRRHIYVVDIVVEFWFSLLRKDFLCCRRSGSFFNILLLLNAAIVVVGFRFFVIMTSYKPYPSSSSVLSHSRTADIPNQLVAAQLTLEKMHPIYLCINPSPVYPSIQSASHQWVSPTIRLSILQSIYFRLTKNAYATLC